jgi:hypothetical protein
MPENENKDQEYELEDDQDGIEIVDDTPEADRDKGDPIDPAKAEISDEEISQYSANVQHRIREVRRAYHDERRAKEQLAREREEAIRFCTVCCRANRQLQEQLSSGEKILVESKKDKVSAQISQAERDYKEAYETGDSDKMLEAQKSLARYIADQRDVEAYRPVYNAPLQQENIPVQMPKVVPDDRTRRWAAENQWFDSDPVMRSAAFSIHDQLVAQGYKAGSEAYFEHLDAKVRESFPHKFESKRPASVVASASRSSGSSKIKVTKSAQAMAKILGVSLDDYVKQVGLLNQNKE